MLKFKCFLFFISFIFISFISTLKVDAAIVDLIEDKQMYFKKDTASETFNQGNEASKKTFDFLFKKEVVWDLSTSTNVKRFSFDARGGVHLSYINFYDSNFNLLRCYDLASFGTTNKVDVNMSNIRYVGFGNRHTDATKIKSFKVFGDDGKLSDISDLKNEADVNKISFNWSNPDDERFAGVAIYKDSKYIATVNKPSNSYVVHNLQEYTNYNFNFVAFSDTGYNTKGIDSKVSTLMALGKPPIVSVAAKNKGLIITWNWIYSRYLQGYNVYVDGNKVNQELITGNKLILKKLENGKTYKIQVSTVNKSGAEGEKSIAVEGTPKADATTIDYDDVKISISVMDFLLMSLGFFKIIAPFVLLMLCFIFYKPLMKFVKDSVKRYQERKKR